MAAPVQTARPVAEEFAETMPEATRRREYVWQDPLASVALGAEMTGLEYIQAIASKTIPPPPIAVLLDMGPTEIEEGRVVFSGHPAEEHYNPIGVVHGGIALTMLDSAMSCAVQSMLPAGKGYTTLELKVNLVRAITGQTGLIRATGKVLHLGRQTGTAEGRLEDSTGKLLAHGTTTCIILSG